MFHPIPELVNEPTAPITTDEVEPDPIEDRDLNDDPNATNTAEPVKTIPTAKRVPGRPGFVFNPFTQNMVDVDGIPEGTKVRDPQDDNEDHLFIVP